uniref:Uncharacterized protein n=1 Tax=Arion vulgaris TaxID=1028688 RepID=A0A0B6ZST1_9EUPU
MIFINSTTYHFEHSEAWTESRTIIASEKESIRVIIENQVRPQPPSHSEAVVLYALFHSAISLPCALARKSQLAFSA